MSLNFLGLVLPFRKMGQLGQAFPCLAEKAKRKRSDRAEEVRALGEALEGGGGQASLRPREASSPASFPHFPRRGGLARPAPPQSSVGSGASGCLHSPLRLGRGSGNRFHRSVRSSGGRSAHTAGQEAAGGIPGWGVGRGRGRAGEGTGCAGEGGL